MEASVSSIRGLIQSGKLLRIPYFQRSYVWGKDDWERFAIDMEATIDGGQDYFLGAIILKKEEEHVTDANEGIESRYLVVDGQQRLTTLNVYMKVLYSLVMEIQTFNFQYFRGSCTNEPVLEHSREDRAMFAKVMNEETPRELNNVNESNIIDAYNYFLKRMQPRIDDREWIRRLINTINAHIRFVVITLQTTDDEQQIFDTINSLGVPLTTCDMVKNFLYRAGDEDAYNDNWRIVFEGTKENRKFWATDASKSRQEKTKDNTTVERFFHAFVRIKMWDFKDMLSESQRKNFVKMSNVLSTCKAFHEKFGMEKLALANEIIEYAKLFKEYLGDGILDDECIPRFPCIKRISCFINATKLYSVIPYVLFILHEVKEETERNRIFGFLETYLVRRILVPSNNNSYSDLFTENLISNKIKSFEGLKEYLEGRRGDLQMPSDLDIQLSMNIHTLSEKMAHTILYLYETKLENKNIASSYNNYYAEMLMPKSNNANENNWPHCDNNVDEEVRKVLISTLGNYFLLDVDGRKHVKKIAGAICSVKVDEMRKWSEENGGCMGICSNQMFVPAVTRRSLDNWTADCIRKRNNFFANNICNRIWNL